jgi:hypothetical protein
LALTAVACGSGLVCERYGTAACVDPNWAEWPMPNDTTVDPGAPNAMSYTDNGDGTITDNVTGLVWQKTPPSGTYTCGGGSAQTYCATLTLAGYSDWRLPSILELVSIVDPGRSDPSINTNYFPGTPAADFCSSTLYSGGGNAWSLQFRAGSVETVDQSNVRCVR